MRGRMYVLGKFAFFYLRLLVAWIILHTIKRDLLEQDIWLVREKRDEARDNGFHFYKYLKEHHPEINAFYVIKRNAVDRYKVEKYGNLIDADSWKHCVYFLAAKYSISSQPYGAYPFHFSPRAMNYIKKICNKKQKVIFLQHGIIKASFPMEQFGYDFCNIDFFVTSAKREYEFVKNAFGYPEKSIGCVGLARFDYLCNEQKLKNQVLVMPTWRKWIMLGNKKSEKDKFDIFKKSDYFKAYSELLSDKSLIEFLRERGFKLVFYMHYQFQHFVKCFDDFKNDVIIIADKENFDVQELLMSSKIMITDYSSVYFDFAYMNKPLMYYCFDEDQFHKSHYLTGYFTEKKDGFGPCFGNWEQMKPYLFETVLNDCQQPEKYALRVNSFFSVRDNKNCERTYEAIKNL